VPRRIDDPRRALGRRRRVCASGREGDEEKQEGGDRDTHGVTIGGREARL